MGTQSNRSSGSQFNPRGVTQGNTLVDPNTGLPISVIEELDGSRRLAVDANVTIGDITVDIRDLSPVTDGVFIGDHSSGNRLLVNNDGSINVDVLLSASQDNVAIADATTGDKLTVNPDGSINVNTSGGEITNPYLVKSVFNTALSVSSGSTQTIITYTVPVAKVSYLERISVSGQNIATYDVLLNSVEFDRRRTYFGGDLTAVMEYTAEPKAGVKLLAGDVIQIQVTNFRPSVADFESRLQVIEVG